MSSESESQGYKNLWANEADVNTVKRPFCNCLDQQYKKSKWRELILHKEQQETESPGWVRLLELIDEAARDGRQVFSPSREMTPSQWAQIITLPASIGKLKEVKHFILYGSSLVRIPPEIGEMTSLEEFTPYTSYQLHWFPYEITRCKQLKRSTVSTRALYGNSSYRPHFPRLPQLHDSYMPTSCSVCDSPFGDAAPMQYWVSLRVATDVLPLLVHACSAACLSRIPKSSELYVQNPHQGGLELKQPPK